MKGWWLALLLVLVSGCVAEPPARDITARFEVAYTARSVTPEEVLQGRPLDFRPLRPPENLHRRGQRIWLRADLPAEWLQPDASILDLPGYMLIRVHLLLQNEDGHWVRQSAGSWIPFQQRAVRHHGPAFRLPPAQTGEAVQLLIYSDMPNQFHFTAMLWQEPAWYRHAARVRVWHGVLVGGMLVLALYNLFMAVTLRDSSHLFYVGYILSLLATVALYAGLTEEYLWPEGKNRVDILMTSGLSLFFAVAFVNRFLGMRRRSPVFFYLSTLASSWTAYAGTSRALNLPVYPDFMLSAGMHLLFVLGAAYYVMVCFVSYVRGMKEARFLSLGMAMLLLAMVVHFLYFYAVIPYDPLLFHTLEAGALAEGVLMSLALADRVQILEQERQGLQQRYRHTQREFTLEWIATEESERERYATLLHDSVGHGLLVLKQQLDRLQKVSQVAAGQIAHLRQRCLEMMTAVRQLSHELHPHMLRRLGLEAAVLSYMERRLDERSITWAVHMDASLSTLPHAVQTGIYRITQEALGLICTREDVSEVIWTLRCEQGILLEIHDDGSQDEAISEAEITTRHLMRGYARLLRGDMAWQVDPDAGRHLRVRLPPVTAA